MWEAKCPVFPVNSKPKKERVRSSHEKPNAQFSLSSQPPQDVPEEDIPHLGIYAYFSTACALLWEIRKHISIASSEFAWAWSWGSIVGYTSPSTFQVQAYNKGHSFMHWRPSSVPGTMLPAGGEKWVLWRWMWLRAHKLGAGKARGGLKGNELGRYQVIMFISLFPVPTANKWERFVFISFEGLKYI